MTLFRILLNASGLSLREAAEFLNVTLSSIENWSAGRRTPSPALIARLHDLVARQQTAAENALDLIERAAADPDLENIKVPIAGEHEEARSAGWPTASAHAAVFGRVLGMLPPDLIERVMITPPGKTVAAETIEQH